jgi:hypothetical protein
MWIGVVMQCNDILCECTGMLSLDDGMKVSEGFFMNFGWLTTLSTRKLNDNSLLLFGKILHL